MQVKVEDLSEDALDWLVATLEGWQPEGGRKAWIFWPSAAMVLSPEDLEDHDEFDVSFRGYCDFYRREDLNYSQNWDLSGPIGDRERINVVLLEENPDVWAASIGLPACPTQDTHLIHGPTRLIAMLRCFVVSRLGRIVDIPNTLYREADPLTA
jgi:hypothetical protein